MGIIIIWYNCCIGFCLLLTYKSWVEQVLAVVCFIQLQYEVYLLGVTEDNSWYLELAIAI